MFYASFYLYLTALPKAIEMLMSLFFLPLKALPNLNDSYPANMIGSHRTLFALVLDALRSLDDDGLERHQREGELDDEPNQPLRVKHELVPRRVSVSDKGVQPTNLRSRR